jgi:hypothetical protein
MQRGDLLSAAYVEAAAAWARAVLEKGSAEELRPPAATDLTEELAGCFGLSPVERRILDLALGVDRSSAAARLVRERSGRGRPTVALLGELLRRAAVHHRLPARHHDAGSENRSRRGIPHPLFFGELQGRQ